MAYPWQTYLAAHPSVETAGNAIGALMSLDEIKAFQKAEVGIYLNGYHQANAQRGDHAAWNDSWEQWYGSTSPSYPGINPGIRWLFYAGIGEPASTPGYNARGISSLIPYYMSDGPGFPVESDHRKQWENFMQQKYLDLQAFLQAHRLTNITLPSAGVPDTQNDVPVTASQTGSPTPSNSNTPATGSNPLQTGLADSGSTPAVTTPTTTTEQPASSNTGMLILAVLAAVLLLGKK